MVCFENFAITDEIPIYLQIVRYIKSGIGSGEIVNGDEMPSRRILSALLGINPNTIQKAYKILEEENLIYSHAGAKSYVSVTEDTCRRLRTEMIENDILKMIGALKQLGLTKEQMLLWIESHWHDN